MIRTGEGGRIPAEFFNNAPRIFELVDRVSSRVRPCTHQDQGSQGPPVLAPLAPTGAPENRWYQAVSKGCDRVTDVWFSQPETGTSAEQARGLGVLEKLHRGTGRGLSPIRPLDWLPALHRDHSPHPA